MVKSVFNRAAVLTGPRAVRIEHKTLPDVGENQIRVRLEGCGICGSNLPVWEGRPWFQYPLEPGAPGHEGWGEVDRVGANVSRFRIGDRVAVLSYHAYAEYDVVEADLAARLPEALRQQPFPGEALGCAVNVFSRANIRTGEWVAVVGIGFLGALLVQLASRAGARVIAISGRSFAQEIGRMMGAQQVLSSGDSVGTIGAVREMTGGAGAACVIEATGFQRPLDLATELTAERGRLIIAGYHQDGLRQVNLQLWNWRGLDVINAHERDPAVYMRGIDHAISFVESGRLNPLPLYTHRFDLNGLNRAFNTMHARGSDFLKGLVTYE